MVQAHVPGWLCESSRRTDIRVKGAPGRWLSSLFVNNLPGILADEVPGVLLFGPVFRGTSCTVEVQSKVSPFTCSDALHVRLSLINIEVRWQSYGFWYYRTLCALTNFLVPSTRTGSSGFSINKLICQTVDR